MHLISHSNVLCHQSFSTFNRMWMYHFQSGRFVIQLYHNQWGEPKSPVTCHFFRSHKSVCMRHSSLNQFICTETRLSWVFAVYLYDSFRLTSSLTRALFIITPSHHHLGSMRKLLWKCIGTYNCCTFLPKHMILHNLLYVIAWFLFHFNELLPLIFNGSSTVSLPIIPASS